MLKFGLIFLVGVLSVVECKYTRRTTTTTAVPLVSCRVCLDKGDDCNGGAIKDGCTGCVKVTGKVTDVNEVPDGLKNAVEKVVPGTFKKVSQYKGQVATLRVCGTPEILTFAEVTSEDGVGCVDFDEVYGFNDATACLCDKDCD